jgi:hypothetical protein
MSETVQNKGYMYHEQFNTRRKDNAEPVVIVSANKKQW